MLDGMFETERGGTLGPTTAVSIATPQPLSFTTRPLQTGFRCRLRETSNTCPFQGSEGIVHLRVVHNRG